jgi:H+/gluconate symporter-like permease
MKVVLVLVFVLLAAATALALGSATVATSVTAAAVQVVDRTGEPGTLLLSGSLLLGLAGAVKRFTV